MSYFQTNYPLFDHSNMSPFGTLEIGALTPIVQGDFVYGINTQTGFTATSGAGSSVSTSSNLLLATSGTANNGLGLFETKKAIKYRAGQGITGRFTAIFGTGTANNTQIVGAGNASANLPSDGFFFGYNGTTFGIFQYNGGVQTFTAQTSWNGDICDGTGASGFTLNQQKGNVYMIKYPYLGFGNITFYIQNSSNSRWILVHTIQYTNANTSTEVTNPTFMFMVESFNSASGTTSVTVKTGSFGFFLSGLKSFIGNPKWAIDNSKTGVAATETCILNLQNCTTYNGVTNRSLIRLNSLSVATAGGGNNIVVLKLKVNGTIGGTPSYTAINGTLSAGGATISSGNSIASFDTAGTTISNGTYIFNVSLNGAGFQIVDLTPYDIYLAPGDILSITGTGPAGGVSIGVSVNWTEDV